LFTSFSGSLVSRIPGAVQLLVGHWYENRENSSDVSKAPIPFGFSSLLEPYRFIPL
ncbi:phage gp6-like head-tail connector protein, partial [Escherichia coli]|nr:phage gp6-like head-tail connector protein [Escherichia coli]